MSRRRRRMDSPLTRIDARLVLRMTRPGFLVITWVACWLGFALAHGAHAEVGWARAGTVLVLALLLHAAANVLNDYHDACNGADAANQGGLFPFTGGARFIQQGVVSPAQTRRLAWWLLLPVVPGGLWLVAQTQGDLLWLGVLGGLLAWAYSAPPLALMCRGWGEFGVGLAWTLVVLGAARAMDAPLTGGMWIVAASYGCLIANILLINGVPDAPADASVGKRTLTVRLGARGVALLYAVLNVASALLLLTAIEIEALPRMGGLGVLSVLPGLVAAGWLWRHARAPERLRPAIVLTILASVLNGLGVALGCVVA